MGTGSEPTASRAAQQVQSAHAEWCHRNGPGDDENSLATVAGHGGGVFGPMDPEERGGVFAYLDSPDRFNDWTPNSVGLSTVHGALYSGKYVAT